MITGNDQRFFPFAQGFWGPVRLPGDGFRSGAFNQNLSGGGTPGSGISTTIFDVRVEANDIASATLRWIYEGLNDVKVYRSTDNITYTLVNTTVSTSPVFDYIYIDDGTLAERTLYYYKLSDDNGATFSPPVHVVSYINAMHRGNATSGLIDVVPATSEVPPELFNALVDKINLNNQANFDQSSTPCDVCSQNNALIIDCTNGCTWFRTILTESDRYINSISLVGCDGCPQIDFVIPPNQDWSICGWPIGCNYEGDECYEGPIPGGPNGRVAKTGGWTFGGYWNAAPPGKPMQSCPCSQASTVLSIQNCTGPLSCV
jgi:hypothetical protein